VKTSQRTHRMVNDMAAQMDAVKTLVRTAAAVAVAFLALQTAPARAAISQQAPWTQEFAGTTAYPAGTVDAAYAVAAGSGRLLVVAVSATRSAAGTISCSASYGGTAMTLAAGDGASASTWNHSFLFYMPDTPALMDGTGRALAVTCSGGTAYATWVFSAVYAGVDQTSPLTDARNYNSTSTTSTAVGPFSPGLTIGANDQAIEIVNLARSAASTTARTIITWATGWSTAGQAPASVATNGPTATMYIRDRNILTAAIDPSQHTASSASTWDSMTAMAMKMAVAAPPGTPGTPTYTAVTNATLTVTWTAATGATSYNLQRAADGAFTTGLTSFTTVTSPYADAGPLTGNTTYWYRVVAVNAFGSTMGAGSSVLTQPAAPAAPTFSSIAQTSLSVTWSAPTGGATSYNVQRATDSAFTANLVTSTSVTSPFSSTGLVAGTTYWYRVQAVNASGTVNGTGASTATLPTPPGTPGTPTFSGTTASGTTVTWTASSGATSYDLQRALDSGFTTGLVTTTGVTSPSAVGGLVSSTTYWFRVVANNAGGSTTGLGSSVTTSAGPPGPPGTPTYTGITQVSATVSWTAASGATSYNLQRATDSGFTIGLTTFTTVTSPYTDSGPLTANTTYWYRVVAVNGLGTTTGNGSSVATLPPLPGAPGTPTFSAITSGGMTVSWTPGSNATSYNLQRAANSTFTLNLTTRTGVTSPYADSGLTPSTAYWYRAVSVNAAGSTTGASATASTAAAASLAVAAGTQPAGASVQAAAPATIVFRVQLTATGGTVTLTSIALGNAGTATTGDVAGVQVLNDVSGALIATGAWTGSKFLFGGLSYGVTGTTTLRFVLALSSGASAGRTFIPSLASGDVAVAAPSSITAFTGFSGSTFTVAAGATEGDPAANSTGPVLRIVNPADGGVVTLSPAAPAAAPNNAFRVQVYVYNPGGLAALTAVSLSTDNGATWPLALTRNANYFAGDLNRGMYELNVSTLSPGMYTLRAQAINAVPKTVLSGPAVITVNSPRRGDGNLLRRDNSSQLCIDCHAIATHSSETTSSKYGSWMTTCLDCHTAHSTTNIYLVQRNITPPAVNGPQGSKAVKFSTTTGDSNSAVVTSASFVNSDNSGPCQVCHTRTSNVAGTSARWRNTGNADSHYTAAAGTQACSGCHPHSGGFKPGESAGGVACNSCHPAIVSMMTASASKHSLVGAADTAVDTGGDWGTATVLSSILPANRSCVNMCHDDHPHTLTTPATATHEYNLYADPTNTVTRAEASASTNVIRVKTDFDSASNTGACSKCHAKPIVAGGLTITEATYGASAHDFTSTATPVFSWSYGLHDGSLFLRNCTKCHASNTEGTTPAVTGVTALTAVHGQANTDLLAGVKRPNGVVTSFICYNCHGSAAAVNGATGNRSNKTVSQDGAKASRHPFEADNVHDTVAELTNANFGNTLGVTGRHSSCMDCHDPHEAKGGTHAVGGASGNVAGPSLQGAWGAKLSTNPALWAAPTSASFTKVTSIVAGTDLEASLCFKCHSSYYWGAGAPPNGLSANGTVTTPVETDVAMEFNPNNKSAHPVLVSLNNQTGSTAPKALASAQMTAAWSAVGTQTMACSDCHGTDAAAPAAQGPHGSASAFMLKGTNKAWPNVLTSSFSTSFCANCHVAPAVHSRDGAHTSNNCSVCHIVVPHGGKLSRLICDNNGAMPVRYAYSNSLTNCYIQSFAKASSDTLYTTGNCQSGTSGCTGGHSGAITGENW
jgi:Fibronectin type III domain/NapC/NirT cytochrome c family, N-terminal region